MRHKRAGRKLKRNKSHRKALFSSILRSLFRYGQITTTLAKAKECSGKADKIITLAKRAERKVVEMEGKLKASASGEEIERRAKAIRVAYLRRAVAALQDKLLVHKIFFEIAPLYAQRQGGYTSVFRLNKVRVGDNAPQAVLRLVEKLPEVGEKPKSADEKKAEKEKLKKEKIEVRRKQRERKEKEREKERLRKQKEKQKQEETK